MSTTTRHRSTTRIGLVTTRSGITPKDDLDAPLYAEAAERHNATITMLPWGEDPSAWADYDIVAFRSPWDYPLHVAEFEQWLPTCRSLTNLHNPAGLVTWNLDKRYLNDLHDRHVPVVASLFATTMPEVEQHIATLTASAQQIIVKPSVSAGSRNTGRFNSDDPNAHELAAEILALNKTVLLQPAIESVAHHGETAMLYFDSVFSHAVNKGPLLATGGGLLSGEHYAEDITGAQPTAEQARIGAKAMRCIQDLAAERNWLPAKAPLLYGRIDLVETAEGPAVLEAELFEPSLFLWAHPDAADRFIQALCGRAR